MDPAETLVMFEIIWANSPSVFCFVPIYIFIISSYDLLDSWGSNLLTLWSSGHNPFNVLNLTSMHYRLAKLDWPEHTTSITIYWPQWGENVHKTGLVSLLLNLPSPCDIKAFHIKASTVLPVNTPRVNTNMSAHISAQVHFLLSPASCATPGAWIDLLPATLPCE